MLCYNESVIKENKMFNLFKHDKATQVRPEDIHKEANKYDTAVQLGTYANLGQMADQDRFKQVGPDGLPLVVSKEDFRAARAQAIHDSGEHPAVTMTGKVPAVSGEVAQDTVTPGDSAFIPGTITPIGEGGVTVNPRAPAAQPEVRVNMPPTQPQ